MKVKNATKEQLSQALDNVNKRFDGNINIDISKKIGNFLQFRLGVESSKAPGARRSPSGRRIAAACWHAHGFFFEELFEIAPMAEVRALDRIITVDGGNWIDWNIGSVYAPCRFSTACECE